MKGARLYGRPSPTQKQGVEGAQKGVWRELSLTMVNLVGCGGASRTSLPCGVLCHKEQTCRLLRLAAPLRCSLGVSHIVDQTLLACCSSATPPSAGVGPVQLPSGLLGNGVSILGLGCGPHLRMQLAALQLNSVYMTEVVVVPSIHIAPVQGVGCCCLVVCISRICRKGARVCVQVMLQGLGLCWGLC